MVQRRDCPKWLLIGLLLLVTLARPVAAQEPAPPPDPRFGIVETYVDFQAAATLRAGYTRIILRWDVIQPRGPSDWEPANVPDPFVAADLAAGREVVAVIIGTPAWARDPQHPGNLPDQPSAKDVPDMEHWANFVSRLAQHYQGRIRHWVIWNEPDVWDPAHPGSTWNGAEADYVQLLKTAYLSIKAVDPSLQVHLTGLTYFWDWEYNREQYLSRLLRLIAADPEAAANNFYFDAVVFHLYYKPELILNVLSDIKRVLSEYGQAGKPIWMNETNAPPSSDTLEPPHWEPRFRVSLEEQSAFILQIFAVAFANGVERVEVYKLRNSTEHPEDHQPFGLMRGDGSFRPAFHAYQVATTYLAGFQNVTLTQQGDIYIATFDRGTETTTVLWTVAPEPRQIRLNAIAAEGLLLDEVGQGQMTPAQAGTYTIDLPAATCSHGECFIGGAPRLLVEAGSPEGRGALLPPPPATPTDTPQPTLTPAPPTPTPTLTLTATFTPTPLPTATPLPESAVVEATPAAALPPPTPAVALPPPTPEGLAFPCSLGIILAGSLGLLFWKSLIRQ